MDFLVHRFWHSSVVRDSQNYIIATTTYSDDNSELAAVLRVDVRGLKIEQAYIDHLGRPGDVLEKREDIPQLKGITAYLGCGRELRQGLQNVAAPVISLFQENITAIVQAETFLYAERGYASPDAYNQAWEQFYRGSCRYYSQLEDTTVSWADYIGMGERRFRLFDRFKSLQLHRSGEGRYVLTGSLMDSFHQISTCLELDDKDLRVLTAEGCLVRVPDSKCREAALYLDKLNGQDLKAMSKKELAQLLGSGQGCVHLISLLNDSRDTLLSWQQTNGSC